MAQLQNSVPLTNLFRSRQAAAKARFATHPTHTGSPPKNTPQPSNTPRWTVTPWQVALAVVLTLTYGSLAYLLSHLAS